MVTASEEKVKEAKEGTGLLGEPTFEELDNGRLRCAETGHELLSKDRDSYSQSKRCRLGLIDFALSRRKPPLNMFKQDPLSRSKLICKLTGDTINKTEEHIWKHINGRRFLNKLEQKEVEKLKSNGDVEEMDEENQQETSKSNADVVKKKKKKNKANEIINEVRKSSDKEGDIDLEPEFWMPPVGDRWDFDDGQDRWGSGSESDESDSAVEKEGKDSEELTMRTKRMSIEIGPSSFASRKKKSKKSA